VTGHGCECRLAQKPLAVRRDVLRRLHGAPGHSDRRLFAAADRRRAIGGAGRDQLGTDRLPDRRDHRDPVIGLADPRVLDTLAVCRFGGRLYNHQPALRSRLEHRDHDRLPGAARAARCLDDPDHVHIVLLFLPRTAPGLLCGRDRDDCVGSAEPWAGHRRLAHRHARLALAVLRQSPTGGRDHGSDSPHSSGSTSPTGSCSKTPITPASR
jgi:hypothetical protein